MKFFSNFSNKVPMFSLQFHSCTQYDLSGTLKEESENGDLCKVRILSQYLPSQIPSKHPFWE